jgi:hypothetical protein
LLWGALKLLQESRFHAAVQEEAIETLIDSTTATTIIRSLLVVTQIDHVTAQESVNLLGLITLLRI